MAIFLVFLKKLSLVSNPSNFSINITLIWSGLVELKINLLKEYLEEKILAATGTHWFPEAPERRVEAHRGDVAVEKESLGPAIPQEENKKKS